MNIDPDEKVLLLLREHKFLLVAKLMIWAIAVALPFVAQAAVAYSAPDLTSSSFYDIWILVRTIYLHFCLLGLLLIIALYDLNYHIVTNKRIVDSDQLGIIHHHTAEMHTHKIQDVAFQVKGLFGHIFNYGDVSIQTAGDVNKVIFENVPNPKRVKEIILDQHYRLINKHTDPQHV